MVLGCRVWGIWDVQLQACSKPTYRERSVDYGAAPESWHLSKWSEKTLQIVWVSRCESFWLRTLAGPLTLIFS